MFLPRKKSDPDRIIDDDDFLEDSLKPSVHNLPKDLGIIISPSKKERKQEAAFHVDKLTTEYLGNGKLPIWMKDTAPRTSRKEGE
jgi:hypothetical protein